MEFLVAHEFDADIDTVAGVLLDEGFQNSLGDVGNLAEREVLSQESDGNVVIRRTRCVIDLQITGAVKRFIGDSDPAWVEVAEWNERTHTWKWVIEPEVRGELLDARGVTELVQADDGQTIRRVKGSVKLHIPIYGGKVERIIIDGLEAAYDEEAERLAKWIAS